MKFIYPLLASTLMIFASSAQAVMIYSPMQCGNLVDSANHMPLDGAPHYSLRCTIAKGASGFGTSCVAFSQQLTTAHPGPVQTIPLTKISETSTFAIFQADGLTVNFDKSNFTAQITVNNAEAYCSYFSPRL